MIDQQTNVPETDYFFLGDGRTMAVIQWSRGREMSPYGLLLYDPERMSRKNGALLFHPELGLARTMLTVVHEGTRYSPRHEDVQVTWNPERRPSVAIRWKAGPLEIGERFSIQPKTSNLLRDVTISAPEKSEARIEAALYANPLYFDEFGVYPNGALYASGYTSITLYGVPTGSPFERFLTIPVSLDPGHSRISASFVYALQAVGTHEFSLYPVGFEFPPPADTPGPTSELGAGFDAALQQPELAHAPSLAPQIEELFNIARFSMTGAISRLGKFDASIWQYDYEWGMDAAMTATAAATSGLFDLARAILVNILTRLSNPEGMIAEASRFRGGEMSELNGNGAVLDALLHYWRWTGDETLLRSHWHRIAAIADYPLREEFAHPSGLLMGRRDLWERFPWMGVQSGFELAHQVFCSVGLRGAAELAERFGTPEQVTRWRDAAERIKRSMLEHPRFSLIENGAFIHRRLVDGSVQETLLPDPGYRRPDYEPYISPAEPTGPPARCEPDVANVLPIVYGLVDPRGEVALRTLEKLRALWNPTGTGGYARYNIESEPDSPGPWPFASAFVAAAEIEAGLYDRAKETIGWLLKTAGAGGSWLEFYGERNTPPYPPVGIIVWGWAQFIILTVEHIVGARIVGARIAGARITGPTLRIAPTMIGIDHTLRIGAWTVRVVVRGLERATLDGEPLALDGGAAVLPLPLRQNHRLEFE